MNRPFIVLLALWSRAAAAEETARSGIDPHYAFFRPDPRPDASSHSYYPSDHDFTDYSQHITRTTILQKNSASALPPSGPYFAHELRDQKPVSYSAWNSLDYTRPPKVAGSKISGPVGPSYGPPDYYDPPIRPMNKPPRRKHKRKRPVRPVQGGHHVNNLEKVSPGAQSIAAAYPNGVMGTLSLLAGVVWFLVNKSATPVVKMRSGADSDDFDNDLDSDAMMEAIRPLDWRLASLLLHLPHVYKKHGASWSGECQQRATCEILAQYPVLSNRVVKSIFRSSLLQRMVTSVQKASGKSGDVAALFRAAADGQKGADCSVLYSACPIPFRMLMEARDR